MHIIIIIIRIIIVNLIITIVILAYMHNYTEKWRLVSK